MVQTHKKHKGSLVIWGGFGGDNMGDEAILYSLVNLLKMDSRFGNELFVLIRGKVSPLIIDEYSSWGISIVPLQYFWKVIKVLSQADLIVGGGQLVDDKGLLWPTVLTGALILLNRLMGRDSLIIGIGVEKMKKRLHILTVKFLYSLARVCSCRDVQSLNRMKEYGFPEARLKCIPDLAFTLPIDGRLSKKQLDDEINIVVIPNWDKKRAHDSLETLVLLIDNINKLQDPKILMTIMAHDIRSDYDLHALKQLRIRLESLESKQSCKYLVPKTLSEVLTTYQKADVVISPRMHPIILASIFGALPIPIAVSDKSKSITQKLSLTSVNPDDPKSVQMINEWLSKTLRCREALRIEQDKIASKVKEIRELAQQNGFVLKLLGRRNSNNA